MRNKQMPCKECIVLAICRNKTYVECDILYSYLRSGVDKNVMSKELSKCFNNFQWFYTLHPEYNDCGVGRVVFKW